jgi:acyl-coenzyme A synthetase/AMP-(fatty) acid ligase
VVVAEIPRNPSGKILKRVLREQFKDTVRAPE